MKKSHLRSVVHNLTDSLSSECSTFLGYAYSGLWEHIDRLPAQRLEVDLLTGVSTPPVSTELQQHLKNFAHEVPKFLRGQHCDLSELSALRVEFRRSLMALPSRKEAIISIERTDGSKIVDRYVGDPLKRPQYLDIQGRRRTNRRPRVEAET